MIALIFVFIGLTALVSRKLKVTARRELSGLPAYAMGAGFLLLAAWLQAMVAASNEVLQGTAFADLVRRYLPNFSTHADDLRVLCTALTIGAGIALALGALVLAKEVGAPEPRRMPNGAAFPRNATRARRLCCWVLDSALIVSPAFVVHGVAKLLGRDTPQDIERVTPVIGLASVAICVLQWWMTASTGQSLAKGWFGIRVARPDGSPPGFFRGVVLRGWLPAATAALTPALPFLGFVVLFDALRIFGSESRCLHDLIADTSVVEATERSSNTHDWSEA